MHGRRATDADVRAAAPEETGGLVGISRYLLALFFVAAGAGHFISPQPYLAIMPPLLPWPLALVYISGLAELAGGISLLFKHTRKAAGIGLMALLTAVFPANVYAALYGMEIAGQTVPTWILWTRLPLQAVLIWWVYEVCWKAGKRPR